MTKLQEALKNIVSSCRTLMRLSEAIHAEHFDNGLNLFDYLNGSLEDALYFLCDENTDTLEESTVDKLLKDNTLSDEQIATKLLVLVKRK